jgi:AAA family ATP:ADP antiporter
VEWIRNAARDPNSQRRAMAAIAIRVRGDEGTEALHHLLQDDDPQVVTAAAKAAERLGNRMYVEPMIRRLGDVRVRGALIESLAAYGTRIVGTLGDLLEDADVPLSVRKQIPRVLRRIPDQRSVDLLLRLIDERNLGIRGAVLRALNGLRETAPNLDYGREPVTRQILNEARYYYELNAALAPFRDHNQPRTAAGLLVSTLEARLQQTIERLFRLLGLRYPPKDIYAAWLAVHRGDATDHTAAVDFLDSVLERDLKRILLPLLDSDDHLVVSGRDLFGVELKSSEDAIRELLRAGDPWVVACSIATAVELKLRPLADEIAKLSDGTAGIEVAQVARAAVPALA